MSLSNDQFIAQLAASNDIQGIGELLRQELSKLTDVLATAGQRTEAYGQTLSAASGQLTSNSDPALAQTIIEGLLAATRLMENHSRSIEAQLKQSNTEVLQLKGRVEAVQREALTDALTTLSNRKAFDMTLAAALEDAGEAGAFSLIMGDVDHFKRFNDTWGHQTGDQVLKLVGHCFKACTKGRDTAARYGGEEFAVILPATTLGNAAIVAEQIRRAVESRKIVKKSTNESLGSITLSLGVAQWRPGDTAANLVARADASLYAAKRGGRNMVLTEADLDGEPAATAPKAAHG